MTDLSVIDPRFLYSQIDSIKIKNKLKDIKPSGKDFKKIYKEKREAKLKQLKEVSYQIESIFINMIFKEMRKSLNKYRLIPENPAEKIFKDMLYQEYALNLAKSEQLGFSKIIYAQYSKYI